MQVNVEFTGVSRVLTGQEGCSLKLQEGDTLREVVAALAGMYPKIVGQVIEKDGKSMIPTNIFSLNGQKILHENDLQFQPQDGDKLILLSLLAGG
jgi:molybdopterin converting factor small subunit